MAAGGSWRALAHLVLSYFAAASSVVPRQDELARVALVFVTQCSSFARHPLNASSSVTPLGGGYEWPLRVAFVPVISFFELKSRGDVLSPGERMAV